MVVTKYKGDNCVIDIGISNDADSTAQNYGLSLCLKDEDGDEYTLAMVGLIGTILTGVFSKITDTDKIIKNKFYLKKGTTYNYNITAPLPDMKEGKIYGQLGVYDGIDEDSVRKAETTYDYVYDFEKKKFSMSVSVNWK